MGKRGFQSGTLMVRIPISGTRNYYGGMIKRGNRLGKTLASTEGNWAAQAEVVTVVKYRIEICLLPHGGPEDSGADIPAWEKEGEGTKGSGSRETEHL